MEARSETVAPTGNNGRRKARSAPAIPNERWEALKGVIHGLYIKENRLLSEVITKMSEEHDFTAR